MEIKQTFGQEAVGLTFNPSGNDKVDKAKQLAAELIDLLESDYSEKTTSTVNKEGDKINEVGWTTHALFLAAFNETVAAQMAVVKFLTWKD